MKPSNDCLDLIRRFEGFRSKPYLCPAGKWTIGYGCTYWEDGAPVKPTDAPIDQKRADALMLHVLNKDFVPGVVKALKVPVTQPMFDALVDFAFNAGTGNLQKSTLLRLLNAGEIKGAAYEFEKWVFGGGKILPGLVKRRIAERDLFLKGV